MSTAVEELEDQEVAEATDETEPEATEQAEPGNGEQEVEASTPAEIPPEPPADCPSHIREHYDAIREKEREVYALESDYLDLKEQASEAKREFEQADKALRNLISRGADPQRQLPFEKPAEPVAADAWSSAPITELGLTFKQNELFDSIGVRTIGDLEDLRARIAEGKPDAQWPKGIGPAKVTDIENRIVDWLDKNRDKFGEPVAAEAATDVEAGEVINGDFEVSDEAADAEDAALAASCEKLFERAGISDKIKRNVKISANGKAKAKKKARR